MIEEDYVSFEVAKLLKEKGFPQSWLLQWVYFISNKGYHKIGESVFFESEDVYEADNSNWITAPTLSIVQKWLREEKDIHILPYIVKDVTGTLYSVSVYYPNHEDAIFPKTYMIYVGSTYEKALEVGIKKALELI